MLKLAFLNINDVTGMREKFPWNLLLTLDERLIEFPFDIAASFNHFYINFLSHTVTFFATPEKSSSHCLEFWVKAVYLHRRSPLFLLIILFMSSSILKRSCWLVPPFKWFCQFKAFNNFKIESAITSKNEGRSIYTVKKSEIKINWNEKNLNRIRNLYHNFI